MSSPFPYSTFIQQTLILGPSRDGGQGFSGGLTINSGAATIRYPLGFFKEIRYGPADVPRRSDDDSAGGAGASPLPAVVVPPQRRGLRPLGPRVRPEQRPGQAWPAPGRAIQPVDGAVGRLRGGAQAVQVQAGSPAEGRRGAAPVQVCRPGPVARAAAGDPENRGRTRHLQRGLPLTEARAGREADRKSTRLNSSHLVISYAVFCLKKKR